jgi:MFS family permease
MIDDFKGVFNNSKFVKLWTSQILSQVTVNMMNFLLLTKLFSATGSSIATSLLWVAYALPAILIGPFGAVSVDIFSRRKMLMLTNFLQSVTVFSYFFIHSQSIFILYGVVLIYSLINQFYVPAEASYMPSSVKKSILPHANSLFFITQQASLVIGFGIAGPLQTLLGFDGSIIVCGIFLFVAFLSTSLLPEVKPKKVVFKSVESTLKDFFGSIIEGYAFIKNNKGILFPLLLILGIQSGLIIVAVSVPIIAKQILNIPINYAGLSIVVPAGIGATIGSIYVSRVLKSGVRKKVLIETSLAISAFALIFMSLAIPFMPAALRVGLTWLLIVLIGFGFVGINIPSLTYLQETTPIWLRGRVFGSLAFLVQIVTVLPVLFSGFLIEVFGIRMVFVIIGVGMALVLSYSYRRGQVLIESGFNNKNGK